MAAVRKLRKDHGIQLSELGYANFHYTGSIKGMKAKYYGRNALLVRQGSWIYNVDEYIYNIAY